LPQPMRSIRLLCLAAFAAALPAAAADASAHVQARLLAEPSAVIAGKPFLAGLSLKLEDHWHVYWLNPGDAGLPPSLDWSLPQGFTAGPIQWPYPERIPAPPLMSYGYEGEVLLPVEILPPAKLSGKTADFKAKAKWVVCNDICIPGGAEVTLTLPIAADSARLPAADPAVTARFADARARLPMVAAPWKFTARIADSAIYLLAVPPAGAPAAEPFVFFPEAQDVLDNAAPQKFYPVAGGYALELKRLSAEPGEAGPDSLIGVAVSPRGWDTPGKGRAARIDLKLEKGVAPKPLAPPVIAGGQPAAPSVSGTAATAAGAPLGAAATSGVSREAASFSGFAGLLLLLVFAFAGGLILNLMPCVLPVLSLKIFDFVKRAGESRFKVFAHGLVFTGGVLISFWVLAGLLLILRSGGSQLGWGFQLQSPPFLIVLCALFFFFALNLFGVFEMGYLFTRIGGGKQQSGYAGSFMAGVTATVVATPCTAPFMGSAMGYAFTQPPQYALLVFTFLGLGMAAPYLVLSGFPRLMRFLPKPGEWMEHLKQFMGFPLLATAIWLAWVLGKQAGIDTLIGLLFVLLLAGLSAWILGKWTALHRATPVRIAAMLVALVVFVPAFVMVMMFANAPRSAGAGSPAAAGEAGSIAWTPFTSDRLDSLLAAGKPVFVDFTADWCLSCKVNEKVALESPDVTRKFRDLRLTALRADWTLRDATIAAALARYGRTSIPLYVLYAGTGPSDFVILPEIISPGILLDALKRLDGPASAMR
jgi:thiol:disulfide interchange protein/DsbC/DsbD-like thiol-disulfide interchange protein